MSYTIIHTRINNMLHLLHTYKVIIHYSTCVFIFFNCTYNFPTIHEYKNVLNQILNKLRCQNICTY